MPSSRLGAGFVDYWVDGSRRDVSLEDFYTVGPELGRQVYYSLQVKNPGPVFHFTVYRLYIPHPPMHTPPVSVVMVSSKYEDENWGKKLSVNVDARVSVLL